MVKVFAHGMMGRQMIFMFDPLSYFSFQLVLYDWYNKGCGMYYPVFGMVHIKRTLAVNWKE